MTSKLIDNRPIFEQFLEDGTIELESGPILDTSPSPLPEYFSFDRIESMLLGLAIGDSLGNTTEGQLPGDRQDKHGFIEDYLPNDYAEGRAVGVPSDDTQLAFWTLEQLIEDGGLVPDHLADRFCREQIFGMGQTVRGFIQEYKSGRQWYEAGPHSAGNGALMRIAPVLIPHLSRPSPALWADAALAGMVTHNDAASNASCVALISVLWEVMCFFDMPEPAWWIEAFCSVGEQLEGDTQYRPRKKTRGYEGPVCRFARDRVSDALAGDLAVVDACYSWYSAAYLLETVPSVLYILCKYASDPEAAILSAVNDTKDNDTVGAIVGAVVGALHGKDALPDRWVAGLLGRTTYDDDGRIFELIEQARKLWAP